MNTAHERLCETLLPRPHDLTLLSANYALDESCAITCSTPAGSWAGERLANMIEEEWGLHLPVRNESANNEYILQVTRDQNFQRPSCSGSPKVSALRDEEYLLRVDANRVVVAGRTARALLWGAMTLRQLITSRDEALCIQGVEIRDLPHYGLRGFMIDSGRAPNSLPKLKRIIRICSAFKLNALFFREGDDELNAVRYSTNRLGSLNPFAFSMEELAELSRYAEMHGIALIPEVESLGHSTAKGIHYPELVSGGFDEAYPGIGVHVRKSHLAPCDPRTLELLESMYDELFCVPGQPAIHLGLDEVRLPAEAQADHMAGGSGSGHTPYSKSPYDAAYGNLAAWAKWGKRFENYVGLFAVQWSGNMTDEWLPDFLAAADFGWTPPVRIPPHDSLDRRIRDHLSRLTDAADPRPAEVDRPAWDRIWLKGDQWDEEILTRS